MDKDPKWIKLPVLSGAIYVEALAELLDGQDIPYQIVHDWFTSGYGIHGATAVGNVGYIKVPEEHYQQALEIYQHLIATNWVEIPTLFVEPQLKVVVERFQRAELPFFVQYLPEDEEASQEAGGWQIFVPQGDVNRASRLIDELNL